MVPAAADMPLMRRYKGETTFLLEVTDMHPRHHERYDKLRKEAAVNQSALGLLLEETSAFAGFEGIQI